jgi:chromosome segregation ATPase
MKAAKYAQLLSDATAINTTVNFINNQLTIFNFKCNESCESFNQQLDDFELSLQQLDTPPLTKPQLGTLHTVERDLSKITKSLKQSLEKPYIDFRKSVDKTDKEVHEKMLPSLNNYAEPCEFDLQAVRLLLQEVKPILTSCTQKLDLCIHAILKCQAKIATVDNAIQRLNLPHGLEQTTKEVEKITQDLASINVQLSAQPNGRDQYHKEFLPLRAALRNLKLQAQNLTEEVVVLDQEGIVPRLNM